MKSRNRLLTLITASLAIIAVVLFTTVPAPGGGGEIADYLGANPDDARGSTPFTISQRDIDTTRFISILAADGSTSHGTHFFTAGQAMELHTIQLRNGTGVNGFFNVGQHQLNFGGGVTMTFLADAFGTKQYTFDPPIPLGVGVSYGWSPKSGETVPGGINAIFIGRFVPTSGLVAH
jgi:hypothetical protein